MYRPRATVFENIREKTSLVKDDGQLKRSARHGRCEQPKLQSLTGQLVIRPVDVTEILGNKDVTSLLRPRNQTDDSGMFSHRAGATGLQR
jgi:hypothetical protein